MESKVNPILTLPLNTEGRDLIVGDIHGMFALLKQSLQSINFNPKKDRLICCGDLVDRGPSSAKAKDWLEKEWFYSVMGNHDAQYAFHNKKFDSGYSLICFPIDTWYLDIATEESNFVFQALWDKLYPAIEIETEKGLVGVIHAEIPDGMSWTAVKKRLNNEDHNLLHDCMWSRGIADEAFYGTNKQRERSLYLSDIKHVFHGHTINKLNQLPYSIANRYYIDTGANLSRDPVKYPCAGFTICDARFPDKPLFMNKEARKLMEQNKRESDLSI